ncbi:MAG: hypothetical protein H7Z16_07360 [Pyrinomonadaceae bacterium]|nr:hypothetical protein [Pyrinomonadaceae bacterium]
MWISSVSRRELLEVFEPQGSGFPLVVHQRNHLSEISLHGEYTLVWKSDPRIESELPVMMVLEAHQRKDFLAWASTYLPNLKPFTAFCRVLEEGQLPPRSSDDGATLLYLQEICLGLILGEAISHLNNQLETKELSPSQCARTYSFAMARAMALGIPHLDESIGHNWVSLQRLTKQFEIDFDLVALDSVWSIVLSVTPQIVPAKITRSVFPQTRDIGSDRLFPRVPRKISEYLVSAVWTLISYGSLDLSEWQSLTRAFPELSRALDDVKGTREDRVRSLDRYLVELVKVAKRDPLTASFMAGYLTSQVSPGTFDHSFILLPHSRTLSSALLWFGLSAGVNKEAQLKKYLNGLGRRVLRDLLRSESLMERPKCDIAISELEIFMRNDGTNIADTKTNLPGFLEVEIAPCISSLVPWPLPRERVQEQTTRFSQQQIRSLVADLSQALLKAENVKQRLSSLLDPAGSIEDADKRKKKR